MATRLQRELTYLGLLGAAILIRKRKTKWGLALGCGALALRLIPRRKNVSFEERSVVITGGSRGLGLALAQQLVQEGAYVTLLARDRLELDRAHARIEAIRPDRVLTMVCDVTRSEQLAHALCTANDHFGRLDVLINNAGAITVGPYEAQDEQDFRAQMELHLFAPLEAIRLALCYMRQGGGGMIINISSLGGKIPVPHMAPYCASKFALSGVSQAIAPELALEGISVTTVYPGLMRTGSPIQAVFKGDHEKEFAWFAASDVAPGVSLSPETAARRILSAARAGDSELVIGWAAKSGSLAYTLFPEIFSRVTRIAARLLPHGKSRQRKTGAESSRWLHHQIWAKPIKEINRRAQRRYNQMARSEAEFNLGLRSQL
ncbi:MAG: SDR family NAD(P)-dependent oxidoreductase [Bdellovibrionales bacterium]